MEKEKKLVFRFPLDGDVLIGASDGILCTDGLRIEAAVVAPPGACVMIDGKPAAEKNGQYIADVVLQRGKNRLEAVDKAAGEVQCVTAYYWPEAHHTYRFTVDDCIRAFENLHRNRERYHSVFDDPYLSVFREAHERYGSHTHMNVFYETCDGSFNLSMMTERYREEFSENAGWLTFSFHSRGEFPDRPYENAFAEAVLHDEAMVYRELARIAGNAARRDMTTIHWGSANLAGVRALRERGYRLLNGYFVFCHGEPELNGSYALGEKVVSYYLNDQQVENLGRRCAWVDTNESVAYLCLHLVLNAAELTADRVEAELNRIAENPAASEIIQMVIHEQYFYPDYRAFEPDYAERILTMACWMQRHGYRSLDLPKLLPELGL